MSDMDYVYAVARIRCKELKLFSAAVIEQLLARPDYDACVSFLAERAGAVRTPPGTGTRSSQESGRRPGRKSGSLCRTCLSLSFWTTRMSSIT